MCKDLNFYTPLLLDFFNKVSSPSLIVGHAGDRLPGSSVLHEVQPPQSEIPPNSSPSQHPQPQVPCPPTQNDQTQQQPLSVVGHFE